MSTAELVGLPDYWRAEASAFKVSSGDDADRRAWVLELCADLLEANLAGLAVLDESVTLAEIDAQRTQGWPGFHAETYCHRCGHRNVRSWYVASDLWATIAGQSDMPSSEIVCPSCFDLVYSRVHGAAPTWQIRPAPAGVTCGNARHPDGAGHPATPMPMYALTWSSIRERWRQRRNQLAWGCTCHRTGAS